MIHPDVGRFRLGTDLEADLSDLPLDEPIPESRLPKSANLHKAFFDGIMKIIREENPTLRQLYLRYERGRKTIKGTPTHIADVMEQWVTMGATDGFMMQFATLPGGLQDFVTACGSGTAATRPVSHRVHGHHPARPSRTGAARQSAYGPAHQGRRRVILLGAGFSRRAASHCAGALSNGLRSAAARTRSDSPADFWTKVSGPSQSKLR